MVQPEDMFGTHEARRAALYRQLGALESAGIPLGTAVHKVVDTQLGRAGDQLEKGEDPGTAWDRAGFSPLDVALVRAGAKGGMLAGAFHDLEHIYEERANAARRLVVALAYPVLLLHLVVLLPSLPLLIQKGVGAYFAATLIPIVIAWGAIVAATLALRAARASVPQIVDPIIAAIPPFGGLLTKRAISRALRVLGALYKSGVPIRDAIDAARDAAMLHTVAAAFERVGRRLDGGVALGDAFLQESGLPVEVREAASTGALTGQLDQTLAGAERRLDEEARMRQGLIMVLAPVVIFLLAAAGVAWKVIGFYSNMYGDLLK
jgi:type II secretory pathway component PulF